jgi:(2R)-3-sulfolactate dehydrogenase (NADP+)
MTATISTADLTTLCAQAARKAGADQTAADALATATVAAEQAGNRAVGVAHLFDYLQAYQEGRISSIAVPEITHPALGCLVADAHNGLAQVAFDSALPSLLTAASKGGIAALWLRNCFTCGELGHYPRQLANHGFLALACANSPALMALGGSTGPVVGTNPLAYAVPRPGRRPFLIDQATSATAYVNVRDAARAGEPIPPGWAVGPDGAATTDAAQAMRGALLPFGGYRGGNIALLVEFLATLAGASFSIDAPPFDRGQAPPGIGVFVLCMNLDVIAEEPTRVTRFLDRLHSAHGVSLPAMTDEAPTESIRLDATLHQRLLAACAEPDPGRGHGTTAQKNG